MLNKKSIISIIAVFITMMVYGFAVFGVALESFYNVHAANLPQREEGQELMHFLALAQILMSIAFVWVWKHDAKGEGIMEGLRFGFFMGLFWGGTEMIMYSFMPMETITMVVNYAADIVMMMVAGAVLSLVWQKLGD